MAVLEVISYPNALLKQKSLPVEKFDATLHRLLDDMLETMRSRNGVGLAAVQVGVHKRALLILIPREDDCQYDEDLLEVINPVITHKEGEIYWNEGCLSVPGFYEEVLRYEYITLEYQDRFGNQKTIKLKGFKAVAIQHEMDHLDGILFIDRLSLAKRKKFEKEYKRLRKER